MEIDKKFIIDIKGKSFIKYEGLLDAFHRSGGEKVETELIQTRLNDETFFVFKATVSGEKGSFTGYGDACVGNVGPMIKPHMLRMAETRAVARAFRLYNNIGMCSVEELN